MVRFNARSPYTKGRSSLYPLNRGRVDLRASVDAFGAHKNLLLLPKIESRLVFPPGCILGTILLNDVALV